MRTSPAWPRIGFYPAAVDHGWGPLSTSGSGPRSIGNVSGTTAGRSEIARGSRDPRRSVTASVAGRSLPASWARAGYFVRQAIVADDRGRRHGGQNEDHRQPHEGRREGDDRSVAVVPPPASLPASELPSRDHPTGRPALQVTRQRRGGSVSVARLLLQALQADRFQVAIDPAIVLAKGVGSRSRTCRSIS